MKKAKFILFSILLLSTTLHTKVSAQIPVTVSATWNFPNVLPGQLFYSNGSVSVGVFDFNTFQTVMIPGIPSAALSGNTGFTKTIKLPLGIVYATITIVDADLSVNGSVILQSSNGVTKRAFVIFSNGSIEYIQEF